MAPTGSGERPSPLSHLDEAGHAHMVDVGEKPVTTREALARAELHMLPGTLALILEGGVPKGDVLAVARIAGVQAAKRTPELIPLCHALPLSSVQVEFASDPTAGVLRVEVACRTEARTGVEMEALTGASVAALTVYDMCKAVERGMRIGPVELLEKRGGRSGEWVRSGEAP